MAKPKKAKKKFIKIPVGMRTDRISRPKQKAPELKDRLTVPKEETKLSKAVEESKKALKRWKETDRLIAEKERQMKTPKLTPITQTKLDNIQKIKRIIIKGTGLAALKEVSSPEEERLLRSRVDTLNKVHGFLKTASMKEIADSLTSRKQLSHVINKEVSAEEFAVIKKSIALAKDKDALLRGIRATRGELEKVLRTAPEKISVPPAGAERGELATAEMFGVPGSLLYTSFASNPRALKKLLKDMRKAESGQKLPRSLTSPEQFAKKFGVTPTAEELESIILMARSGKTSELEEGLAGMRVEKPFAELGKSKRKLDVFQREMVFARARLERGEVPEFLKNPEAFQKRFGVKPSKAALAEIRRMIENGQTDLLLEGIQRAGEAEGRLLQRDLEKIRREKQAVKIASGITLAGSSKRLQAFKEFNQKLLELVEKNKKDILNGKMPKELTNTKQFKAYFGLTPEEAEELNKRIEKGALIGGAAGTTAGTVLVLSQAALFAPMPLLVPISTYAISGFGIGGLAGKAGEEGIYKARQLKTKKRVKKVKTKKDYDLFIRALRANIREADKRIKEVYQKSGGRKK